MTEDAMGLLDQHAEIRGTPTEDAILLLYVWPDDVNPASINTLRSDLGESDGQGAYFDLRRRGYIEGSVSLGAEAVLTPAGRRLGEYVRGVRSRGGSDHADLVRRLILQQLDTSTAASIDELVEPDSLVFGEPVTSGDVRDAADWLKENGLISFMPTFQGAQLRPTIKALGRQVLRVPDLAIDDQLHRREGSASVQDNRSYTNTLSGPVGAVVQGDGNLTSVSMNIAPSREQLDRAISIVEEIEAQAKALNSSELGESVAAIRSELEAPEPTKEGILAKVGLAFGTAMATGTAHQVVDLLAQLPRLFS